MKAAATFTDSLYLNAQGNANAVFVIQILGALTTSTYSKVLLINGTQAKNVYWMVEGAVSINNYSVFCGTIICNNGAFGALNTGVILNGRALLTDGALNSTAINATIPSGCGTSAFPKITLEPTNQTACVGSSASFSVVATGTDSTYKWRKGTSDISGATSATFTINSVKTSDAATNYNVIISGTTGPNDTSINVSLKVNTALNITKEISNQSASVGSSASFSVVATGTDSTFQWKKGTVNITNTSEISGATTAMLTINPVSISDTGSNYNVVISGTCAPKLTSIDASLTVYTSLEEVNLNEEVTIYPNPFSSSIVIKINDVSQIINYELMIYNILGEAVINTPITRQLTILETSILPSGIYFYKVTENGKTIQTGKLDSQQ